MIRVWPNGSKTRKPYTLDYGERTQQTDCSGISFAHSGWISRTNYGDKSVTSSFWLETTDDVEADVSTLGMDHSVQERAGDVFVLFRPRRATSSTPSA